MSEPRDVFDLDPKVEGAQTFVQWKGTDVCMDVTCACGASAHVHGMFVYFLRCAECGAVYAMPSTLALIPVPEHLRGELDGLEGSSLHVIADTDHPPRP